MSNLRKSLCARPLSSAAFGLFTALAVTPAHAQDTAAASAQESQGLGEIIVTAQRRAENLQQVPIAVTAFNAETMKSSGVDTTRDLPMVVPSVQFTRSGGSGLIFVRGVGTTNAAVGEEGSNAVYIDNVYMADLGQAINNFNNIERIEVLKGPQGTLFGRNATGGLIHIITRDPGDEVHVKGQVGYGNYDTYNAQLYVGGPVGENVKADFAWTNLNQNDGWGKNLTLKSDTKVQDYWGARSKILWTPTDHLKFKLAADYYRNQDNLALAWAIAPGTVGTGGQLYPGGWDTTANKNASTEQEVFGVSLTGDADLGFGTLTSVTAYRKTGNKSGFDVDGGPANLINIDFSSGGKSFQQEFRLASNDTDPLSWQTGIFYLHSEAHNDSMFTGAAFAAIGIGQHILADLTTDSIAGFGEATYTITPKTKITAGLRYTTDERDFDGGQANVNGAGVQGAFSKNLNTSQKYNEWTYRVALKQDLTDDINVYASYNHGFKAGTYSLQAPLNAPVLPQFIDAYEIGLKSEWFDRKLRVNLAAYHYDIEDYQVRSAATAAAGSSVLLNAATVTVNGFDLEFEAKPVRNLNLFGGITVLDSTYDKFGGAGTILQAPFAYPSYAGRTQATTCPAALRGTANPGLSFPGSPSGGTFTCFGDASGLKTPNAPEFTASLGGAYTLRLANEQEVQLAASYSYNDGYVFEPDNFYNQDAYSLVNASIEYRPTPNWAIALWGKNLGDEEYAVQKLSSGTGTIISLGAPLTYGVDFKFDF